MSRPLVLSTSAHAMPRFTHVNANYATTTSKNNKSHTASSPSLNISSVLSPSSSYSSLPPEGPLVAEDNAEFTILDDYDDVTSLNHVYSFMRAHFPLRYSHRLPSMRKALERALSAAATNRASIKRQTARLQEAIKERDDAKFSYEELMSQFESLRLPEWADRLGLERSIEALQRQAEEIGMGGQEDGEQMMDHDSGGSNTSDVHVLIHKKFVLLERIIRTLRAKLARLEKYPYQQEIEAKYGNIEGLMALATRLTKENEKLRRREARFFHEPLLKRRVLADCRPEFIYALVQALQNELANNKEIYKAMTPFNNAQHPLSVLVAAPAPVSGAAQGHSRQGSRDLDSRAGTPDKTARGLEGVDAADIDKIYESAAVVAGMPPVSALSPVDSDSLMARLSASEARAAALADEVKRLESRIAHETHAHRMKTAEDKEKRSVTINDKHTTMDAPQAQKRSPVKSTAAAAATAVAAAPQENQEWRHLQAAMAESLDSLNQQLKAAIYSSNEATRLLADTQQRYETAQAQRDRLLCALMRIVDESPDLAKRLGVNRRRPAETLSVNMPKMQRMPSLKRPVSINRRATEEQTSAF